MIRQQFSVEDYWKVIVWYDLDFNLLSYIHRDLSSIGFSKRNIDKLFNELRESYIKAVTCSNEEYHTSVVILKKHTSKEDYINSIVHEAEHVKQAMLSAYRVEDRGEPPAYTLGYLVMRMYEVFKGFLCK
jgi:hypothetical protein